MADSLTFTVDVFRTVCDRFRSRVVDLQLMIEDGTSFQEWLTWEAYLACKLRQAIYPYCEVAAKPGYGSEGVKTTAGESDHNLGDLRVGGPNDGANHCWLFAEFVLAFESEQAEIGWTLRAKVAVDRLKRLGWKKSAALLIVVMVRNRQAEVDVTTTANEVWNWPALTDPCVIALPGGKSIEIKAFDIKQNPADTLRATSQ